MFQVSERALIARINRKLAPDFESVRRCSPHSRSFSETGRYYLLDHRQNWVSDTWVDISEMANDLGVLRHYERFDEPE